MSRKLCALGALGMSALFTLAQEDCESSDADNDGWEACEPGQSIGCDCDDNDFFVHPGATEVHNNTDDDCNDFVDEGVPGLDAGYYHSASLRADGSIYAWGYNSYGQLGEGTTQNRNVATRVSLIDNAIAVDCGRYHTIALDADGTVWSWGYNGNGELGNGTTTNSSDPAIIDGLERIVGIAAGDHHNFAWTADGTIYAWGWNGWGQLGDGTTTTRYTPVEIDPLDGRVIEMAGGYAHTIALTEDGTFWGWGDNSYGEVGAGLSTTYFTEPVLVDIDVEGRKISAGYYFSLGVSTNGILWAWGLNDHGQLGDGSGYNSTYPVEVEGLAAVSNIAAGYYFSLAVVADGTVWAWGYNPYGNLGDGTTTSSDTPVQVEDLVGPTELGAGWYHSISQDPLYVDYGWGYNGYGEVGDGTTTTRYTPVLVEGF